MLQGYTMAIVPCGNPTPKKLPTGGGEWPTFRTARAQRVHSARYAPYGGGGGRMKDRTFCLQPPCYSAQGCI